MHLKSKKNSKIFRKPRKFTTMRTPYRERPGDIEVRGRYLTLYRNLYMQYFSSFIIIFNRQGKVKKMAGSLSLT